MRKYFLLSAVALLAATNVMAENFGNTVEINAKIEKVTAMECASIDFGTIYLKNNNVESTVSFGDGITWYSGDVVDVIGATPGGCQFSVPEDENGDPIPYTVIINDGNYGLGVRLQGGMNPDEDEMLVRNIAFQGSDLVGILEIPENMPGGTYTGSFGITIIVDQ